jgi:hypothetical protein
VLVAFFENEILFVAISEENFVFLRRGGEYKLHKGT